MPNPDLGLLTSHENKIHFLTVIHKKQCLFRCAAPIGESCITLLAIFRCAAPGFHNYFHSTGAERRNIYRLEYRMNTKVQSTEIFPDSIRIIHNCTRKIKNYFSASKKYEFANMHVNLFIQKFRVFSLLINFHN